MSQESHILEKTTTVAPVFHPIAQQVIIVRRSPTLGHLALALSKAQGAMGAAKKDCENPFFKSKYADIAAVTEASRDHLTKNELAFTALPQMAQDGKNVEIVGLLMHSSGEWIEGSLPISMADYKPQSLGSAITYYRRYLKSAIVDIATEDDDGEAASHHGQSSSSGNSGGGGSGKSAPTEAQLRRLVAIRNAAGWSPQYLKDYVQTTFRKTSAETLTWMEYDKLCKFIETHPNPVDDHSSMEGQ